MRQGWISGRALRDSARLAPVGLSRRTLLTLGGLTVVGFGVGGGSPASAATSPAPTAADGGGGGGARGLRLRGDSHPGNSPVPSRPTADSSPTSAILDGTQVQSSPEYFVNAGQNVIGLTIDDGPDPTYTPQVLDVLREYGVTATFFLIGEQIQGNESLVTQVVGAGHMIGNHTWDHSDPTLLSADQVADQISQTSDALGALGITPAVFRAPYGNWNDTVFQACADANLRPVDWSVDPQDWSNPGVDSIVDNIMANTASGSIILEHDGGGDRSQTVAALKTVLPQLLNDGYTFTAV